MKIHAYGRFMNRPYIYPFALVLFLAGCMLPISSEDMPGVIKNISESNASACLRAGASGGGGAAAITPVPVPGGGWGSADLLVCRSNEPGSEITVTADSMTIKHGGGITAAMKERLDTLESAVKYLVQKLVEAATAEKPAVQTFKGSIVQGRISENFEQRSVELLNLELERSE